MSRSFLVALAAAATLLPVATTSAQWPFGARESIEWIESSDEALRSAAASGRPILAYVSSKNCTFCRKMDRETWTDTGVADRVRAGFTPLRLQAETNPEALQALQVRAFPTTVLLSPEGRGLGVLEGYVPPERLAGALDRFLQPAADSVAAAN